MTPRRLDVLRLTALQRRALLRLDPDNGSEVHLQKALGISSRSLTRVMSELERKGIVSVRRVNGWRVYSLTPAGTIRRAQLRQPKGGK